MDSKTPILYLIATAHLDTVWNWDLEQTVTEFLPDTLNRNFELIEKYPEYKFNFEGAYRYLLIKEFFPEKYEELKKQVENGRWCPTGSAFENGDVNIPSPEGLMRNFLYGNNFFEKEFGKMTMDVFLPDCFGFSHSLPSIASHMGLKFFSTAKLVWNADNYRPFDLGKWYGPDGNFVVSCLNPCAYISDIPENYQNSDALFNKMKSLPIDKYMRYYGVGDMGGAPREDSVCNVCGGVKNGGKVRLISGSVQDFIQGLKKEEIEKLPSYNGELVMKTHGVGAYTSRGILKRLNRKNEIIADQAERFGIMADRLGIKEYPYERLTNAWKRVICHQFHDDITGTATNKVYENSINEYIVSLNEFAGELTSACELLSDNIETDCLEEGTPIIFFNSCCFKRKEVVEAVVNGLNLIPGEFTVTDAEGKEIPSQLSSQTAGMMQTVFIYADIPSMGYKTYYIIKHRPLLKPLDAMNISDCKIENGQVSVELNDEKNIKGIYIKKTGKNILSKPICFEILKNTYTEYGAWEILYQDICSCPDVIKNNSTVEIIENGPLRNVLKITRKYRNSKYVQLLTLDLNSDIIKIEYNIDWKETASLLKLRITADEEYSNAVYDGGIGIEIEKNNHEKKYEFIASRWVALTCNGKSENLLMMSDCKYGWDKPTDNALRLTAIHTPYDKRSDVARHDMQDFGDNRFGLAITVASDDNFYKISDEYNYPIIAVQGYSHSGNLPREDSFIALDTSSVTVRAVKRAEKSNDIIIRLYNTSGVESNCGFKLPRNTFTVYESDGTETKKLNLNVSGNTLRLKFKPFETKTIGLVTEKGAPVANNGLYHILMPTNTQLTSSNVNAGDYGFGEFNKTIPSELIGDGITACGMTFNLNRDNNGNAMATICCGQEIVLPDGTKRLYILGGSVAGDKNTYFTVSGKPYRLNIKGVFEPIGKWDQFAISQRGKIKTDTLAFYATHTHGNKGDCVLDKANLFVYEIDIPEHTRSVKLPFDMDIIVASAIASVKERKSRVNGILYDIK